MSLQQQKWLCLVVCLGSIITTVSAMIWLTIEFWSIIVNEWVPLMIIIVLWCSAAFMSIFLWRGYRKICRDHFDKQKIIDRIIEAASPFQPRVNSQSQTRNHWGNEGRSWSQLKFSIGSGMFFLDWLSFLSSYLLVTELRTTGIMSWFLTHLFGLPFFFL